MNADANNLLDAALAYGARGWHVFPLRPKTKDPYRDLGVYKATNDAEQIRRWWKQYPNSNIGIHCGASGLLVLDPDSYKDTFEGTDFLNSLDTNTPTSLTGGGGSHLAYRMPDGKRYGNATGGLKTLGIDIRGWGGYIVAPPSIHPSGKTYQWELGYSPDEIDLLPLPDHLKEIFDNAHVDPILTDCLEGLTPSSAAPNLQKFGLRKTTIEKIHDVPAKGARSEHDASIIASLVNAGASNQDILNVYTHYPCGVDGRYSEKGGSAYLARTINRMRQKLGVIEPTLYPGFEEDIPDLWLVTEDAKTIADQPPTVSGVISEFADAIGKLALCDLDDRIYLNGNAATDAMLAPMILSIHDYNGARDPKGNSPYIPIGAIDQYILSVASKNRFHPVQDWMDSLSWDGESHIHALATHFKDNHPKIVSNGRSYTVFECLLSRWLIGAVDRAFTSAQNPVLVLAGGQGLGKSFLPSWLAMPLSIANGITNIKKNPYYCEGNINPESIEHQRRLATKFIWEIGEVGATMRRADQDALKQFITEGAATFRTPYSKHDVTKPALCNWIATVNPTTGFLNDPTGNRRFRTVELTHIDWTYSQTIDASQVWAQAVHWWRTLNWTSDLNPVEKAVIEGINASHMVTDDETEALLERYRFSNEHPDWAVYTADVVDDLILNVRSCKNTNVTRVGRALSRLTGSPSKRLKGIGLDGRSGFTGVRLKTAAEMERINIDSTASFGI